MDRDLQKSGRRRHSARPLPALHCFLVIPTQAAHATRAAKLVSNENNSKEFPKLRFA